MEPQRMSDDDTGSRLPPPAFPPGSRKHVSQNSAQPPTGGDGDGFSSPGEPASERAESLEDAFISPDEPIPERHDTVDDAFISPDEPIPHHDPVTTLIEAPDSEEGVVTGMGHDAHMDPDELSAAGDPYVMALTQKVGKLAEALRQRGEAGLRTSPGMDKFESTLRGYCVGYLAGRRAEDDDSPDY